MFLSMRQVRHVEAERQGSHTIGLYKIELVSLLNSVISQDLFAPSGHLRPYL